MKTSSESTVSLRSPSSSNSERGEDVGVILDALRSILPAVRHALEVTSASDVIRQELRHLRRDLDRQIRRSAP